MKEIQIFKKKKKKKKVRVVFDIYDKKIIELL